MFPFWDTVIAPVISAVDARRVIEIGALRGETTVLMLDALGPDAELHVIDPAPEFDPREHERSFPGRYHFHPDLSLNVLPNLPPADVALIDGDHNWYTVYNELKQLSATAAAAGAPMPVLIMHDVGWPYGRRDLYYNPETIPEEHRHEYAQRGIRPGRSDPVARYGGFNPTMNNATHEGGPRNGVMTALEDFMAEHPKPLELLFIPIYFGLAIVTEKQRLVDQPALADVLRNLDDTEGLRQLLELGEDMRLRAMIFQHNVVNHQQRRLDASTGRYLTMLKKALLDEHYIENELRINYLVHCLQRGWTPEDHLLRDPKRWMRDKARRLRSSREAGRLRPEDDDLGAYFPYTTMGRARLDRLEESLAAVLLDPVPGDLVECGTGRGGGGIFMRGFLAAHDVENRRVWVADRFRATPDDLKAPQVAAATPAEASGDQASAGSTRLIEGEIMHEGGGASTRLPGGGHGFPKLQADLNTVRDAFDRFDLLDDQVRFLQGELDQTLDDAPIERIALLRFGSGLGAAVGETLELLRERLSPGAFVLVDDYSDPACRDAVDAFRARHGITTPLERIDWAGACWRHQVEEGEDAPAEEADRAGTQVRARPPLMPSTPSIPRRDLTVVVVFYNMRREAERTLHSLSRSYQQGIEDLNYEVIAVENGSDPDQKLGREFVRSFGREFHYIDMGRSASPSPVPALNRGIRAGHGDAFALMIDGAHVLTPGVLRYGMLGLRTYEPAVVSTQQWYLGPTQQGEAMAEGYDQRFEDKLFGDIEWPMDGYRLFDVGQFIGERDWLDGMWESNCLFMPRSLLAQVGAYDESFDLPGGEYANLDLYERLASSPDVNFTTILGEGSFHQIHGGTTTNQPDTTERRQRIASYAKHYEELRGRSFRGHNRRIHYVGTMFQEANRTKARRRISVAAFKSNPTDDPDGKPESPTPIPEQLQLEYTDAFWRSLRWRKTTWLGRQVPRTPTDLFVYQELISQVRPGWVIETSPGNGGRALFLASICELLGEGRVLSVGERDPDELPQHPRITYLRSRTLGEDTTEKVRQIVGDDARALVVLGTRGRRLRMMHEFNTYREFVPVGSYVVMEETIVNGHPVWPSFGPGPAEAVRQILIENADFAADTGAEKFGLTFNRGGFLKRIG